MVPAERHTIQSCSIPFSAEIRAFRALWPRRYPAPYRPIILRRVPIRVPILRLPPLGTYPTRAPRDAHRRAPLGRGVGRCGSRHPSPATAIASRWPRRSIFTASRACHRSTLSMVIAALASALVTPWSAPSTWAAPAAASSRVSRSGCRRPGRALSGRAWRLVAPSRVKEKPRRSRTVT